MKLSDILDSLDITTTKDSSCDIIGLNTLKDATDTQISKVIMDGADKNRHLLRQGTTELDFGLFGATSPSTALKKLLGK